MKRRDLLRYLAHTGCVLFREGSRHSIFYNPIAHKISTVPRHIEIDNFLVKKICRDLDIGLPEELQ